MDIAIVVPCYKRADALETLCDCLVLAEYEGDRVSLIFSIDYAEGSAVPAFAERFKWPYGEKVVIKHDSNIGLRNNILYCGDLTQRYDAVIILEDDLEVMPAFYHFAKSAAVFYENDDRIAGISIYQYFLEEVSWGTFLPIYEGYDNYFIKWASSWGQLWTRNQWQSFRNWYNTHQDISNAAIPSKVKRWKESWKKYFIAYLNDTKRYFVFPYRSFVYNGNKGGGTHSVETETILTSSPLERAYKDSYSFALLDNVKYTYDSFFQLESQTICVDNVKYEVEFDTFGRKEYFHCPYVVTSRKCKKEDIIFSFDAGMLPIELNVIGLRKGKTLSLIKSDNIRNCKDVPYFSYGPIRKTIRNWRQLLPLGFISLKRDIKSYMKSKFSKWR